jgi:HK97 family phage portal protein
MKNKATFIGAQGVKGLSLTSDADWVRILESQEEGAGGAAEDFRKVAWLYRGVMLRAQALGALPFAILKGGREVDRSAHYANRTRFFPNPMRTLTLVESALSLFGYAYLFKRRNRVRPLGLRYVDPGTITPKIDKRAGLTGFTRDLNGQQDQYEVADLIYFWGVDPFVEIGHPKASPAKAALAAAGVLLHVDEFASAFFKRGAIKATVFSAPAGIPEAERLRFRDWLRRFFGGGMETAHAIEVLNADKTEATVIGEGIHELSDNALTREKREDIATALGVPHSLLFSNAATYATAKQDELHFQSKTVLPEAEFIQQVLNDQLFMEAGYRFEFRPEEMALFQEEEVSRAAAFRDLSSRLPVSVSMRVLGFDLPAGVSWEDIDALSLEYMEQMRDKAKPSENALRSPHPGRGDSKEIELRNWRKKALKRFKQGKGAEVDFESVHIGDERRAAIEGALAEAQTPEELHAAFAVERED